MSRPIVLSIHRRYAEAIAAGTKTFELRRRNLGIRCGDLVLLYETAPDACIRSAFVAGATLERPKAAFYDRHHRVLGVERAFYDEYLGDSPSVFATEVLQAITFPAIAAADLEGFTAPQGILHWRAEWPLPSEASAALAELEGNSLLGLLLDG